MLAQLLIGVLGVLVITADYSTGMIRSTYAAVPKRLPVLWAKAGVLAVVTGVLMLVAVFTAFFTGQAILSGDGTGAALTDPGVLRAVLGSVGYLAGPAWRCSASRSVRSPATPPARSRHSSASCCCSRVSSVSCCPAAGATPSSATCRPNAAAAFTTVNPGAELLSPGAGLAVFAGYLVVLFGAAAALLVRRDA